MRTTLMLLVLLTSMAWSQQQFMRIKQRDGTLTSIAITDIRKITFTGVTGIDEESARGVESIISTLVLLQNYPNPFNPTTTIEFELSKVGVATVGIFDLSGRLVRSFTEETQSPGVHRVVWDGKNQGGQQVASGAYFYQVKFDNAVLSRRMLLLK